MKKLLLSMFAVLAATVSYAQDVIEVTCAQAKEIALALSANNTPTDETYAVTGYITNTDGKISREQQVFWMADTKDGGKVFEAYWANIPDPTTALTVGTKVKLTGKIMKYNTVPEIKNGAVEILEESTTKVDTIVATAAEAYAEGSKLAKDASTVNFYDITAYVDSITFAYSNGTMSFTMTDTKGVKGTGLVAFKTSLPEAALVGAKVRVVGVLTNFNGTIEVMSGTGTILEQGTATADTTSTETPTIGGIETFENGGFEEWVSDKEAKGWKSTTTASNATVSKSTDSNTGNYAIMVKNASSTNKRLASKEFLLDEGGYTFEFYAKAAADVACKARAGYAPWNAAENAMGTYEYAETVENIGDEWVKISYTFVLAAQTQINLVVMNPKSTDTVKNGDLLIDDAVLRVATQEEIEKVTAISATQVETGNADIYDLSGRKVSKTQKGLYIQNGKVIVK